MCRAETLEEADFYLTVTGATVLLTDVTFLDGTWRDALRMASETHPRAAAIVVAEAVDYSLLSDAYDRGACGLLWKPVNFLEAIDLIRTLNQAACDRVQWLDELFCRASASTEGNRIPVRALRP